MSKRKKKTYFIPCPQCSKGALVLVTYKYKSFNRFMLWDNSKIIIDNEENNKDKDTTYDAMCSECDFMRTVKGPLEGFIETVKNYMLKDKPRKKRGPLALIERPRDAVRENAPATVQ